MASKDVKGCLTLLALGKCKLKQRDIITLIRVPKVKTSDNTKLCKNVEKLDHLYIVGGNVK